MVVKTEGGCVGLLATFLRAQKRAELRHRPSSCTACALRAYCGHRGWDTHPRIPVTCLVARRSSKAHMRTMKMPSRAFKGAKHPHAELRIYTCIGSSMCNCTLPFVFWELILASILKAFKHDCLQCFPSLVLRGAP